MRPARTSGHGKRTDGHHLALERLEERLLLSAVFGPQRTITTATDSARDVYAADLDGDGDADVLSASGFDDTIAWYENLGGGDFGPQQIIEQLADDAGDVHAADLDGDGDMDVLSASQADDALVWYENDGAGSFGTEHVISTGDLASSVATADLDGDGDLDVLATWGRDNKVTWYRNDGAGGFGPEQVVSTTHSSPGDTYAADLDGDGDSDVLVASSVDDKVAWYENDGVGGFGPEQILSSNAENVSSVYATDLDGDGDADVLSAWRGVDKVVLHENLGGGSFGPAQYITSETDSVYSVYACDLDGDGDADVLSASIGDDKVAWYENDGTGSFGPQKIITDMADRAESVYATDLDGDGDADVLSASAIDDKIAWYENLGAPASISGVKFDDMDDDGTQDAGELGLPGWTIFIDGDADGLLDPGETSTVTAGDGSYVLADLPAGTHTVAEVPQDGWRQTVPVSGSHDVTVLAGEDVAGKDFGNRLVASLLGTITFGAAHVRVYDCDAVADVDVANVTVKFGKDGSVSSIVLGGAEAMTGLGVAITGAPSVGSIKDARKGVPGAVAFITSDTSVKAIALKSAVQGVNLNSLTLGGLAFPADIDGDGDTTDATTIYVDGWLGKAAFVGEVAGDVWVGAGDPKKGVAVKSFAVKGGGYHGDMVLLGDAGKIALGGDLASSIHVTGNLKALTIKGGDLAGPVIVDGYATKIGVSTAKEKATGLYSGGAITAAGTITIDGADAKKGVSLKSLTTKGGGLAGDVTTLGDLAKVSVAGGDITSHLNVGACLGSVSVKSLKDKATGALVGGSAMGARFDVVDLFKGLKLSGDFTDSDVDAFTLSKVAVKGVIGQTGGLHEIRAASGSFAVQDATWKGTIGAGADHFFAGLRACVE